MTAGAAKTRADRQRAKREPPSQKKTRPKPDLTILQTQVFRGPNYWVNFAITGDPNGKGLPTWTPYSSETEPYLDFGDAVQLRNHLLKDQLDFLEQFQKRRLLPE